jgi:ribose transport system substrate-binding protein
MSVRTARLAVTAGLVGISSMALIACTSNTPEAEKTTTTGTQQVAAKGNDEPGKKVKIGFSAPAADHGWMGAITKATQAEAKKYPDVELQVAEGTNDVNLQISQVETFINQKVDAIVLLPFDGAALTAVATKAMQAGITVINVDREFDNSFAARTTVLGDNHGMGVSAGTYICQQLKGKKDAVVAEIAGIDSLPLTQERSKGFKEALADCGLKVNNRVAAEFTVESGEKAATNLLQAAPKIDAIWNHDDDQGIGVLAAIKHANRSEFFLVGGAGSANMMRLIKAGNSVVKATVLYPPTMASSAIRIARLIGQNKGMSDLAQADIPSSITLYSATVTKDNVDQFLPQGFES